MVLYIWKIIEVPFISKNDLKYKISFELFLFSPNDAKKFIINVIENGFLVVNDDNKLSLSNELALKLKNWHKKRRIEILKKVNTLTTITQNTDVIKENGSNKFKILLKAFIDKATINRAVLISDNAVTIDKLDHYGKNIKAKVKGSQKNPYIIEISTDEKVLKHDCHDFQTKRAQNKKFCKHLVKLFLVLKEKDEIGAIRVLEHISQDINKWNFII